MPRTPYTETEALLLAMDDLEADSGNHEPLDRYIVENFLPRERRKLSVAAALLEERAWKMRDTLEEELPAERESGPNLVPNEDDLPEVER